MKGAEFTAALARTRLKERAANVARLVLVEGKTQAEAARRLKVSREAARAAVARVLSACRPPNWKAVTVILPPAAVNEVQEIERRELQRAGIGSTGRRYAADD